MFLDSSQRMTDWPAPPVHFVLVLYTLIGVLVLSLVSSSYSFECV